MLPSWNTQSILIGDVMFFWVHPNPGCENAWAKITESAPDAQVLADFKNSTSLAGGRAVSNVRSRYSNDFGVREKKGLRVRMRFLIICMAREMTWRLYGR
jgi:hypothetical protein